MRRSMTHGILLSVPDYCTHDEQLASLEWVSPMHMISGFRFYLWKGQLQTDTKLKVHWSVVWWSKLIVDQIESILCTDTASVLRGLVDWHDFRSWPRGWSHDALPAGLPAFNPSPEDLTITGYGLQSDLFAMICTYLPFTCRCVIWTSIWMVIWITHN